VPFLIVERVDGFTPIAPLPPPFDHDPVARRGLGTELVDALAELALVDWWTIGLDGFGKPDGFLARQVDRWLWQLESYRSREIPELDTVADWLRRNLPEPGPIGIMHGDYSMFNVMFAHGAPARLAAILDWDTATIGETLMDLGHVLARWDDVGEEPTALGSVDNPNRAGLPARAELAARYAERTGFDLSHLRYYEVLSLFKLGCIMEGHYAGAVRQGDPTGGRFMNTSLNIVRDAARIARGERP
jgi:aminoglycoside phosphotransferase (APT) family kinase protein